MCGALLFLFGGIMTQQEKNAVLAYRQQGLSFSKIAVKLGLSRDTVKSFYRHASDKGCLPETALRPQDDRCLECGAPLLRSANHKTRRFCSDACRRAWWKTHRGTGQQRSTIELTCAHCGKVFYDYQRNHRRYCSRNCYVNARFGGAGIDE